MLTKARQFYPQNPFWNQVLLDGVKAKGDKKALFDKYEELSAGSNEFNVHFNYGVELFNAKYGSDEEAAKLVSDDKIESVIGKAISLDKEISATTLMANHKYNKVYATNQQLVGNKGTTAAAQKIKADLRTKMLQQADDAIPYLSLIHI